MTQFTEFQQKVEHAVKQCLSSAKQYRETNNVSEAPLELIQSSVTQHLSPLGGADNVLKIVIIEGKSDWRKSAFDLVFRRTLLAGLLKECEESQNQLYGEFDCLDIVLSCCEADLLDDVIPLTLLEELFDGHTTKRCEEIFSYVERRRARLTLNMVPGKGKGLVLLRMCNELLRRLSKETNTVFCGRILMFLANSFPLGERSGVNLRGDFSTETTRFDDDQEVDADTTLTDDQKAFYKLFWSIRIYFVNPPSVFQDENFTQLQQGTNAIVERLQLIAQKEADLLGARRSEMADAGLKRKKTDDLDIMDQDPNLTEQMLNEINHQFQFPRLLSSRKLLDLEMEDARFRRNIIVQYLILFLYLSGFSQEEKDKTQDLLAARGATKQSLVQPTYILSDDQIKWIKDNQDVLLSLLRSTKPHGNLYTEIVLTILEHERHWIIWKSSGCPTFEKPPIKMSDLENIRSIKQPRLEAAPNRYRHKYGTMEMSQLYQSDQDELSQLLKKRPKIPDTVQIVEKAVEELKDSLDQPKDRFATANGVLLQSSRLIHKKHPSFIAKVYAKKKEVYKAMMEENKDNMDESEEGSKAETDFVIGDAITDQHVECEIKVLESIKEILTDDGEKN